MVKVVGQRSLLHTLAADLKIPNSRWVQIGYILADLFFIFLNGAFVFHVRFAHNYLPDPLQPELPSASYAPLIDEYFGFLLLYAALVVLSCQTQGLYQTFPLRSSLDESIGVFKAVVLAIVLLVAFIYLSNVKTVSRLVVGGTGLLTTITLIAWRLWKHQRVERRLREGYGVRNALIVGDKQVGQQLAAYLEENKRLGYVVKGFLENERLAARDGQGPLNELARGLRSAFIDEVFMAMPIPEELARKVVFDARHHRVTVHLVPDVGKQLGWRARMEYLGDFPILAVHREPIPTVGLFLKRTIDLVVSVSSLILLSPLFIVIAAAIKLDSDGPAVYCSKRVGRKGRLFSCYKFRTMEKNADQRKETLRKFNERQGPFFKMANDPRLTRVGKLLRSYSLDELPQLCNVLKGEMSLVGPRPHPTDDFRQYSVEHLRRLDATPGITGLWQVSARRDPSFERSVALDLEYIENWDFWLDVKVLIRTIPAVLRGSGE